MAQLPPDVAQAAESQQGPAQSEGAQPQGGGAKEMLMGAHDNMSKLAAAMAQSGQVDEADIEMASQIVAQIEALADSLGGNKGGKSSGPVPEQAGVKPVKQVM